MIQKLLSILWWVLLLAVFLAGLFAIMLRMGAAQTVGPVLITSAQCATIDPGQNGGTVFVQVVGTWTGTLQPKGSIAGKTAFNLQVVPSTSTVPQSTITANGGYSATVAGFNSFQVCGNTVATGTAKVYLNLGAAHR